MMNARINQIKKLLVAYGNRKKGECKILGTAVPPEVFGEIEKWMTAAHDREFDNICKRHQKKFNKLQLGHQLQRNTDDSPIVDVPAEEVKELKSKWVVNISDCPLDQKETQLLQQGLNFALTPSVFPTNEYIMAVESACRLIGADSNRAAALRAECVKVLKQATLPTSNVSKGERAALKRLKQDSSIMILPADKGRAVVVMNSQDYRDKAKALLGDTTTYQPLGRNPTSKFSSQAIKQLQELRNSGEINDAQYRRLYSTGCVVPRFYILPKIHKPNVPLRPIVASRGLVTYKIAKLLAHILCPLVHRNPHCLKNSAEFVEVLSSTALEEDDVMVSFDVTALFTSVPVDRSLEVMRDLLVG